MRQAYVIMSKWLSRSGIFKELSAAARGKRQGKERRRIESGETFFSMEWSGADERNWRKDISG